MKYQPNLELESHKPTLENLAKPDFLSVTKQSWEPGYKGLNVHLISNDYNLSSPHNSALEYQQLPVGEIAYAIPGGNIRPLEGVSDNFYHGTDMLKTEDKETFQKLDNLIDDLNSNTNSASYAIDSNGSFSTNHDFRLKDKLKEILDGYIIQDELKDIIKSTNTNNIGDTITLLQEDLIHRNLSKDSPIEYAPGRMMSAFQRAKNYVKEKASSPTGKKVITCLSVLGVIGVTLASSGCTDYSEWAGEIKEKEHRPGRDGIFGTEDDFIKLKMLENGYSDKNANDDNTLKLVLDKRCNENITWLNETLDVGCGLSIKYVSKGAEPHQVTDIIKIRNLTEQKSRQKELNDESSAQSKLCLTGIAAVAGIIGGTYVFGKKKKWW